jgi:hypothetical protein
VASGAEKLWSLALDLAQAIGPEREWSLIGGLMVQLHGLEHFDDAALPALFPAAVLQRAQQAFRLLSA